MIDRWQRSHFKEWCDDHGGDLKRPDEPTDDPRGETLRCTLKSEGGRWDRAREEFSIRDIAYVELRGDYGFYVEDQDGETLEITDTEFENLMNTPREDEVDNPEQHDYQSEEVDRSGFHGGSGELQIFGGELSFREYAQASPEGGAWQHIIDVDVLKSREEVEAQTVTQDDMWEEARREEWEQWKSGSQDPMDLWIPGKDNEQWLKQQGLWEEYQELGGLIEPDPEYDVLPCPDRADMIEIEDGVELEGDVTGVDCSQDETRIGFVADGEEWVVTGSPEGWDPIELKNRGTTVEKLSSYDIETFATSKGLASRV